MVSGANGGGRGDGGGGTGQRKYMYARRCAGGRGERGKEMEGELLVAFTCWLFFLFAARNAAVCAGSGGDSGNTQIHSGK